MIEKMIINNARKAMLENITALDKKTLQRELESHLKLEFKYKDELDQLTNNWNELEEFVKNKMLYAFKNEIGYYKEVLDKMKEIKGGNNDKD